MASTKNTISLESLVEMFENIKRETDWDMSKGMLWGYFFVHSKPEKLELASMKLAQKGYKKVDIYLSDKDDENDPDMFWLHVERVETHSPETLNDRNEELHAFAEENGLDCYDGMDVGPANV